MSQERRPMLRLGFVQVPNMLLAVLPTLDNRDRVTYLHLFCLWADNGSKPFVATYQQLSQGFWAKREITRFWNAGLGISTLKTAVASLKQKGLIKVTQVQVQGQGGFPMNRYEIIEAEIENWFEETAPELCRPNREHDTAYVAKTWPNAEPKIDSMPVQNLATNRRLETKVKKIGGSSQTVNSRKLSVQTRRMDTSVHSKSKTRDQQITELILSEWLEAIQVAKNDECLNRQVLEGSKRLHADADSGSSLSESISNGSYACRLLEVNVTLRERLINLTPNAPRLLSKAISMLD